MGDVQVAYWTGGGGGGELYIEFARHEFIIHKSLIGNNLQREFTRHSFSFFGGI